MVEAPMIRWTLAELLKDRGVTAYWLAEQTGLTVQGAYRLAKPQHNLKRLDLDTLDRICRALDVEPGDLLQFTPTRKRGPK